MIGAEKCMFTKTNRSHDKFGHFLFQQWYKRDNGNKSVPQSSLQENIN